MTRALLGPNAGRDPAVRPGPFLRAPSVGRGALIQWRVTDLRLRPWTAKT